MVESFYNSALGYKKFDRREAVNNFKLSLNQMMENKGHEETDKEYFRLLKDFRDECDNCQYQSIILNYENIDDVYAYTFFNTCRICKPLRALTAYDTSTWRVIESPFPPRLYTNFFLKGMNAALKHRNDRLKNNALADYHSLFKNLKSGNQAVTLRIEPLKVSNILSGDLKTLTLDEIFCEPQNIRLHNKKQYVEGEVLKVRLSNKGEKTILQLMLKDDF